MSKQYLKDHGDDVVRFENVIERQLIDEVDIAGLIEENERNLASCRQRGLERLALERGKQTVSTFASVIARPFFERMGYAVEHENVVDRDGVSLVNFLMSKQLS